MSSKVSTKFYTGRLRLGGSLLNEVPITGVPAAEIVMLQHLHGADAVVDLREAKKNEIVTVPALVLEEIGASKDHGWTNTITREYLRHKFAALTDEFDKVSRVFGPASVPVPEKLDHAILTAKADETDKIIADTRAKLEREIRAEVEEEMRAKAAADAAKPDFAKAKALEALG